MDPVDVLTIAVGAAQMLRTAPDPDSLLADAYQLLSLASPADRIDPLAVRIARLMNEAGERSSEVLAYLHARTARPSEPRPPQSRQTESVESTPCADPEAVRLHDWVESV